MRECVRATTAAPSYFTPLVDGPMMYADGAFMANNPTSIALTEVGPYVACRAWRREGGQWTAP